MSEFKLFQIEKVDDFLSEWGGQFGPEQEMLEQIKAVGQGPWLVTRWLKPRDGDGDLFRCELVAVCETEEEAVEQLPQGLVRNRFREAGKGWRYMIDSKATTRGEPKPQRCLKLRLTHPHCEDCQISDVPLTGKRQIHLRMRSDQGSHAIRLVPAPDSTLNFNGEPISSPAEIKALFEECGELRIDCQPTDYLPPYHVLELWGQGDRGFMCAIRAVECDYALIAPPAA